MATPEGQDSGKKDDTQKPIYPFLPRLTEENVKPAIVEGEMHYLYVFEPFEEHVEKLKSFEIRTDDVLLYTFPRSGKNKGHVTFLFKVVGILIIIKIIIRVLPIYIHTFVAYNCISNSHAWHTFVIQFTYVTCICNLNSHKFSCTQIH